MYKKILVIVIVIVAIVILIGLSRQISQALSSDDRLNQVLEDVGNLERENRQLKRDLAEAESLESVEEIARNELNMSLPNETVVIVPNNLVEQIVNPPAPYVPPKPPNWEGWLRLFIH